MKKHVWLGAACLFLCIRVVAQTTFPRNGVYDERPQIYAFTNATLFVDYQTTIQNATLVIRNGVVEAAGTGLAIPAGAIVINVQGKFIYPGLVDLFADYGMPEVKKSFRNYGGPPQMESSKKGPYNWNQAIQAEVQSVDLFKQNTVRADEWRRLGFGAVLAHRPDGIVRGTGTLVALVDGSENEAILKDKASAHYSFDKGSSTQDYPGSLMGAVALLRQTYLDADWYKKGGNRQEYNLSLDAFNGLQSLPAIFEAVDKFDVLRADKVGDEFGVQYLIKGAGDEYQRVAEVKATNASLIVPLSFPQPFDVDDPLDATLVELSQMKHWELAPSNPATLAKAGITFAFTSAGLKDKKEFWPNLRKAVQYGLDEKTALKALTLTPAQLIKADNQLGSLKKGMLANFIISSGNLFADNTVIYENWVKGKKYAVNFMPLADIRGVYDLKIGSQSLKLNVTGKPEKPEFAIAVSDTNKINVKATLADNLITMVYNPTPKQPKGSIRLTGWVSEKTFKGDGETADGKPVKWVATWKEGLKAEAKKDSAKATPKLELGKVVYPFSAFGSDAKPTAETVLIKNATVWTNEKEGKLANADVLLQNGKIAQVGKGLSVPNARVIDGTGKHLTPGVIDEHSHIAGSGGINEWAQSVSAEVRIGDILDADDINIYRQLSGGVVASQILHGSANPIGGQSALIKLKWGESPEGLKIKGADGYIKFALGENVKQSNAGDARTVRYPQTRMGVEQVMMDAFIRAREYDKAMKAAAKDKTGAPVRKDLELEALAEILNNKRFITCHSYVQSEINMLMKVADSLKFKVNTFTHILEGYKVADKMKAHGAGGSTFADWWAYKMEVQDAIPFNAALMNQVGVVTSINSDDAEMARRLNQEAGKTMKYGGVSEEDALKMVTLNPAKLLHLDSRMGSIKVGKDADVVLWSEHPLSIYARAEKTFIEGALYFDLEKDAKLREELKAERTRLVNKMINAKQGGAAAQTASPKPSRNHHCEDLDNDYGIK